MTDVRFYFDVMCPWAYQASVWVREVRQVRDVDVSWGFFSEERHEDNPEPSESSLAVLGKKRTGARVVGSCKPIKEDGDNPPNPAAAREYKKAVGEDGAEITPAGEYNPGFLRCVCRSLVPGSRKTAFGGCSRSSPALLSHPKPFPCAIKPRSAEHEAMLMELAQEDA